MHLIDVSLPCYPYYTTGQYHLIFYWLFFHPVIVSKVSYHPWCVLLTIKRRSTIWLDTITLQEIWRHLDRVCAHTTCWIDQIVNITPQQTLPQTVQNRSTISFDTQNLMTGSQFRNFKCRYSELHKLLRKTS